MASNATGKEEASVCWICEDSSEAPDLIAPCTCLGSLRWVHRQCLDQWRASTKNPRYFEHCRHCDFQFILVPQVKAASVEEQEERKLRRRKVIGQALSQFMLASVVLQLVLFLLAALIRAFDQKEQLVTFWGFTQNWQAPAIGHGTPIDALYYHKDTYYLSAVILLLFLVGCCVVWATLMQLCGGESSRSQLTGQSNCDACCRGMAVDDCCQGECCRQNNSCGNSCSEDLGAFAGVVAIVMIIVGAVYAMILAVGWAQRVMTRYLQVRELRELATEYVVEDLSKRTSPIVTAAPALAAAVAEAVAPLQQPLLTAPSAAVVEEDGTGYQEDPALRQRLRRDLSAVYGREIS